MTTLIKLLNRRVVLSQRLINTVLTLGLVGAVLLLDGWLTGITLEYAFGRYPNAARLESARLDLQSIGKGYFTQDDAYETDDPLMTVEGWYFSRYNFDPKNGMIAQSGCVRLAKTNDYPLFQQQAIVMLCSAPHGTKIYISQTVALGQ